MLNTGFYEEARDQFQRILKTNPAADYAYYGLAILESMTGLAEPCLEHLAKAIGLSPRNRIQARSDSDFQDMADDPRFTELLYPKFHKRKPRVMCGMAGFMLPLSGNRRSLPGGVG